MYSMGTVRFHRRCGDRVTLLNGNCTAVRNFVEFNHGLILSAEPLKDDVLFEISIDRKVNVWNGSLEIGVTTLDPDYMELPATATKLKNTAWIMSGSSIVKDGVTLVGSYGPDLDSLREGDCLGVMRTSKAELMFYVNGRCLGIASRDVPPRLFAVIDLYGQCVQVSIMNVHAMRPIMECSADQIEEDPNNDDNLSASDIDLSGQQTEASNSKEPQDVKYVPITSEGACALVAQDSLRFHSRCGILVKLSNNNRSAERARPLDDYNNGVVMTNRPLYDNELFEIRIDKLVDKWSGSIEVGVTTHNPAVIRFPSTMTNMETGTIMMSGCKILLNGHGTCMEYGNFNLDELREGDTVGMMRKSDGKLHYFINSVDQGVAADKVDQQVWGVVDLYGMTVKVTIVDPDDDLETSVNINMPPAVLEAQEQPATSAPTNFWARPRIDEDSLLFHTLRDSNVIIISDGKTAHRPNAFKYFNQGVVMTNRTLRTNELFQVRLDVVIPKWAGSIEIGVTQNSSSEIEYLFKMSDASYGTWAMTGEDVVRDGTTIIPQYVRNLNKLQFTLHNQWTLVVGSQEGDTVGVMRKDMGILHFFVNGVDQGPAAFNIPEHVFGIIDLYGRVAQATIVDYYTPPAVYSPESPLSSESNATIYPEMCFHRVHGRNAHLSHSRLTASRATVYSEFNDAVLFSSRPLRECDMFELRIDKMVDCWIGSIEIGVTAIRPEDLEENGGVGAVAGTATDLSWDTYILSGAAMMKDGECVRSGYPLDLDTLTVGSRVGMMWHADRSLHYYLDGMDMGRAWYVPHLNIYAVVDLYGQCTQVTIMQNEERAFNYNGCTNSDNSMFSGRVFESPAQPYWSFSEYCGDNVGMMHEYSFARRMVPHDPTATLVFSSAHLAVGEMFEVKIMECQYDNAGTFRMGVTDINILNVYVNRSLPPAVSYLPHYTAYIDGRYIKYSKMGSRKQEVRSFVPSFEWLRVGDRVGLKKTSDGRVLVYYNSEEIETAFEKVPDKVYVVMELYGNVSKIKAVPRDTNAGATLQQTIPNDDCTKELHSYVIPVINESVPATETQASSSKETTNGETINDTNAKDNTQQTVTNDIPTDSNASKIVDVKPQSVPLPYTFHYMHGNNIKLCSSDTVAVRTSGYKDAISISSQPLKRGHKFRFRVDKVTSEWSGSACVGAVVALPTEPLPHYSMHIDSPAWIASSTTLIDNNAVTRTDMASALEELQEHSVLSLHFRFNSELLLDIDGKRVGSLGVVPRQYNHVYPLIDLYGKVQQVSILLHPFVVTSGRSLDLPIITENLREESLAELECNDESNTDSADLSPQQECVEAKTKAYSQDNLLQHDLEPIHVRPGPSTRADSPQPKSGEVKCKKRCFNRLALHHSLTLAEGVKITVDNNETANRCIQKSHSTHSFGQVDENLLRNKETLRHTFSVGSRVGNGSDDMIHETFCDTNIRHNDRYPEANDVDLDYEIVDALTLETGNLPDLTEDQQSSSLDESTRHDDLFVEPWTVIEKLNYLNRIINLDQEGVEGQSLEAEWEASGEGCEHLHLVLKYWNFLAMPYPLLRRAVSWGQVLCYCNNCQPDAQPPLAGWVRIERIDGVGAACRAFWHVTRSTLGYVQASAPANDNTTRLRRPPSLLPQPTTTVSDDIWFDEEYKPHRTVLAIEIDIEGSDAENDRLLAFLIYLKPYISDDVPSE